MCGGGGEQKVRGPDGGNPSLQFASLEVGRGLAGVQQGSSHLACLQMGPADFKGTLCSV